MPGPLFVTLSAADIFSIEALIGLSNGTLNRASVIKCSEEQKESQLCKGALSATLSLTKVKCINVFHSVQ